MTSFSFPTRKSTSAISPLFWHGGGSFLSSPCGWTTTDITVFCSSLKGLLCANLAAVLTYPSFWSDEHVRNNLCSVWPGFCGNRRNAKVFLPLLVLMRKYPILGQCILKPQKLFLRLCSNCNKFWDADYEKQASFTNFT